MHGPALSFVERATGIYAHRWVTTKGTAEHSIESFTGKHAERYEDPQYIPVEWAESKNPTQTVKVSGSSEISLQGAIRCSSYSYLL
jgi:hypothetical protein